MGSTSVKVKTENQSQKTLHQKTGILKKGTIQVQDINIGIRVAKKKIEKGLPIQVHHTILRLKMRKSRVTRHPTIEISTSTPIILVIISMIKQRNQDKTHLEKSMG